MQGRDEKRSARPWSGQLTALLITCHCPSDSFDDTRPASASLSRAAHITVICCKLRVNTNPLVIGDLALCVYVKGCAAIVAAT